jgi:hypothetical protein
MQADLQMESKLVLSMRLEARTGWPGRPEPQQLHHGCRPWWRVDVAESDEEDTDRRERTRTEASSRAETLPKNLIARLPVHDLNGQSFGGLLSRTAVHAVSGMEKTRGRRSKINFTRETEGTRWLQIWSVSADRTAMRRRQGHAASMHTQARHVPNSVGAPNKKFVFHKNEFWTRTQFTKCDTCVRCEAWHGEAGGRRRRSARRLLLFSLT